MDSYSRTVSSVAAAVTPHVASLRIGPGAGSAVVFADDGLMLTNAHVVGNARNGVAAFTDGTESRFDVVGADPLSDLAVLRARRTPPTPALGRCAAPPPRHRPQPYWVTPTSWSWASWWSPSATRWGSPDR
jgi:S1-C subfamily serine protease